MRKRLGDLGVGDKFFLEELHNGKGQTEYEFRGAIPFSLYCKTAHKQWGFEKYAEMDKNRSVYVKA